MTPTPLGAAGPSFTGIGGACSSWSSRPRRRAARRRVPPGSAAERLPVDMLQRRAAVSPDAVAVRHGAAELDLAELTARAARLARHLAGLGAGPGDVVAIALPRSPELVVAIVAVLQAGAAFLVVDVDDPRAAPVLAGAAPAAVITTAALASPVAVRLDDPALLRALDDLPRDDLADADRVRPLRPQDPACVGTAGVALRHRGLGDLLARHCAAIPGGTRVAQLAPLGSALSAQEILATLVAGRTLVIPPADVLADVGALAAWLDEQRIEELCTPSIGALAAAGRGLPWLADVVHGGAPLTIDGPVRELATRTRFRLHLVDGDADARAASWRTLDGDPAVWPASAGALAGALRGR